jgi:uncharacterized membrane protein YphA (DoxX/SURF4 family)
MQVVIAIGILNVWLLRFGKPTEWRGGDAKNMKEEFAVYGLPAWSVGLVGFLKILLAALLIAGIWLPVVTKPAAIGMAVLMLGAVSMHIKVKDPLQRSLPAFCVLVLSVLVAVL